MQPDSKFAAAPDRVSLPNPGKEDVALTRLRLWAIVAFAAIFLYMIWHYLHELRLWLILMGVVGPVLAYSPLLAYLEIDRVDLLEQVLVIVRNGRTTRCSPDTSRLISKTPILPAHRLLLSRRPLRLYLIPLTVTAEPEFIEAGLRYWGGPDEAA